MLLSNVVWMLMLNYMNHSVSTLAIGQTQNGQAKSLPQGKSILSITEWVSLLTITINYHYKLWMLCFSKAFRGGSAFAGRFTPRINPGKTLIVLWQTLKITRTKMLKMLMLNCKRWNFIENPWHYIHTAQFCSLSQYHTVK